ncbi:MAG TPA: transcriptional repressor [Caulobacteraceae bacterium]|nr:transcriptional repressor [Caulobacteraceae bacterium]
MAAALAMAEARCLAAGERWTTPRRRVFELVMRTGGAVKAYDLIDALAREGAPAFPPTVYRALAMLEKCGLVHRIDGLNAFVVCTGAAHVCPPAFLLCERCGAVEEFDGAVTAAHDAAAAAGFAAREVSLEVRGLCRNCSG